MVNISIGMFERRSKPTEELRIQIQQMNMEARSLTNPIA
jgi:hypothetical protein